MLHFAGTLPIQHSTGIQQVYQQLKDDAMLHNLLYYEDWMTSNKNLKFTSWNVRGMVKLTKLKQVITRLKQLKSSIVFIQETHLLREDLVKVCRRWPGKVLASCFPSNSRGDYVVNS